MTEDETQISVVINHQLISMPIKEAVRVYERLSHILGREDVEDKDDRPKGT